MQKKVVITGATGAIGIALIQKCIESNTEVLAFVHKGSKRINLIPKSSLVKILEADIEDDFSIDTVNRDYEVFYHFAWEGAQGTLRNDTFIQVANIYRTQCAVVLAQKLGCNAFIGAGSQAEYGITDLKLTPDTPANPVTGYGIAKLCAGQMSRLLCKEKGLRHVWARILSVYGPFDGENSMISASIQRLLKGKRASFTHGKQLWDYLFASDAAEALYLLGELGNDQKTYVVGNGESRPLKEFITVIGDCLGETENLGIGEIPCSEKQTINLRADITDLINDTGFRPQVSFEEGIRRTIMWEKTKMKEFL